jgi:uncharacterized protein YraI
MNQSRAVQTESFVRTSQGSTLDRRSVLRMAAGFGAAAVTGGLLVKSAGAQEATATAAGYFRTAVDLRLRTGPGTRRRVILVMPTGSTVKDLGVSKNGFRNVSYKGTAGWASMDFLIVSDGGSDPILLGNSVTTTAVNLRSGPSTSNQVLRVLSAGTVVTTSDTARNGFRYVVHNGLAGWVYDTYLAVGTDGPTDGTLTVTTALNLRAEPSTSAKVLAVMPEGSHVQPTGEGSNGFAKVVYGALTGWAYTAYLN